MSCNETGEELIDPYKDSCLNYVSFSTIDKKRYPQLFVSLEKKYGTLVANSIFNCVFRSAHRDTYHKGFYFKRNTSDETKPIKIFKEISIEEFGEEN